MYEVELKVEADHGPIRERLDELDAARLDAVVQEDTYYDAPHRDFAETDEALRVRQERPATEEGEWTAAVTYKGPLIDDESKSREEAETAVESGETIGTILDRLGFSPAATVRKHRERYRLGAYHVVLDDVDDLGEFVEVEIEIESGATDGVHSAREGAIERLRALGIDPDRRIQASYLELLLSSNNQ